MTQPVVDATPALRLFAFQIIAEKLCARIERRQRNIALLHHLQPRFHIGQTLHQRIAWTAVEGKPDTSVLVFEDFDVERFTVAPRFTDYLFGDVMMMNIDGTHKFSSGFNVQGSMLSNMKAASCQNVEARTLKL